MCSSDLFPEDFFARVSDYIVAADFSQCAWKQLDRLQHRSTSDMSKASASVPHLENASSNFDAITTLEKSFNL